MYRLVLVAAAALGSAAVAAPTPAGAQAFSRAATSLWSGPARSIPSPDGRKAIVIRPPGIAGSDKTREVVVAVGGREHRTGLGAWVNAEAAWAPDSRAFFVTSSDCGNVGTYHLSVFRLTASGV